MYLAAMPIIDVRSPSEFAHGHAPGALNMPLFTDEEREAVGICYKQKGQQAAIRLGLSFTGPKMADMLAFADKQAKGQTIDLYCWRGGMRSASVEWLLNLGDLNVNRWDGGYKSYRQKVLSSWHNPPPLVVLSGLTGSGKTAILNAMADQVQVLDLEGLANHKGSSFGAVMESPQPMNEQFENNGAVLFSSMNHKQALWIEDESRSIGRVFLQDPFFDLKKVAPIVMVHRGIEDRVKHLTELYGEAPVDELIEAFDRIRKRLGDLRTTQCIDAVKAGDLAYASREALRYYDQAYQKSIDMRKNQIIWSGNFADMDHESIAEKLIREAQPVVESYYKTSHE
jgi:tRNA 2-selenouridine synthase